MSGQADPTKDANDPETAAHTSAAPVGPPPTPQAPPPKPDGGGGWLAGLLKVAGIFAPLVGKQVTDVEKTPAELRGRLAAAMGAFGILLASLQLLIGAVDLISRPVAMLGRALPFLIAALLAGGALLSARIALRTPARRRRRQPGGGVSGEGGGWWSGTGRYNNILRFSRDTRACGVHHR